MPGCATASSLRLASGHALLGATLFGSIGLVIWRRFLVVNHAYFLLFEESGLERWFGDEYGEHKRTVPRSMPRRRD